MWNVVPDVASKIFRFRYGYRNPSLLVSHWITKVGLVMLFSG